MATNQSPAPDADKPEPRDGEAVAKVVRKGFSTGSLVWTRYGQEADLPDGSPLYTHPPKPDARLSERLDRLTQGAARQNEEICQALGKALGYPWFKDDQKNFPGATEADGVCVGDHVAESLADEAARRIREIDARLSVAMEALKGIKAASAYSIAAIALRQIGSTEKGEWQ